MKKEIEERDKELLRTIQKSFPLTSRPFKEVAERLDIPEGEVISRLKKLMDEGLVQKIGAVLSPKKLGYHSILAAVDIPEEDAEKAAFIINKYTSVTHNYFRDGHPNLWFTLIEPDAESLELHLQELEETIGAQIMRMPVTKMFKIGVKLDF
ncbi:MAG: winged helix-turn-helix transcriptional regulator [Candidatus Bathyarchaeota archaeon]